MSYLEQSTFGDIVFEVGRAIQNEPLVSTATTGIAPKIRDAVNRALLLAVNAHDWPQLVRVEEGGDMFLDSSSNTFLQDSTAEVPLPIDCGRVYGLYAIGNDPKPINEVPPAELMAAIYSGRDPTRESDIPTKWCYHSTTVLTTKVETAQALKIWSNVSNNDNAKAVRVYYLRDPNLMGEEHWEDLTGTFSSGVQLNKIVASGWSIRRLYIPDGWKGQLRIRSSDLATDYAQFQAVEFPETTTNTIARVNERRLIRVAPVPAANLGMSLVYKRVPPRLFEDEDVPEIPVAGFLVEKAIAHMMRFTRRWSVATQLDAVAFEQLAAAVAANPSVTGSQQAAVLAGSLT